MKKRIAIVLGIIVGSGLYIYLSYLLGRTIAASVDEHPLPWTMIIGLLVCPMAIVLIKLIGEGLFTLGKWIIYGTWGTVDNKRFKQKLNIDKLKETVDSDYEEALKEVNAEFPDGGINNVG